MSTNTPPADWAALEAKYKQDIEALTESAEMAAIDKEIAEEKLDGCEKELQEMKTKLSEATQQLEVLKSDKQTEHSVDAGTSDSAVTVLQLQKVEEQNELLKQALIKLRDMSDKDKKALIDLQADHDELQINLLELEEKEQKYLEQIKIFEEQIDVSQSAQEMVEKLTQQKTELEDKLTKMIDDLDCLEQLRDMNEELIESAREKEIELTEEIDKLRVHCSNLNNKRRDMEDYLTDQEKTVTKLKDENRTLIDELTRLKDQFKEGESIEQQKHQIENVAYKLNFSESRMAEKEAEVNRYKRNLAEMEEQMNNLSIITKEQSTRLDELKVQYDAKVSENSELQRALKKKMEEVSELEIRRDLAENKLQTIQKDRETKITDLQREIEKMQGIAIQNEEEMKRLMEDNDTIERERRELRDQVNRSNRSIDRNMQTGNVSMVTAQDLSLASLGISAQSFSSIQASPLHQAHQSPAVQQVQPSAGVQAANVSLAVNAASIANVISPLSTSRRLFATPTLPDSDDSHSLKRVRELGAAFDQMARKNHELELELARRELGSGSTFASTAGVTNLSNYYDIDKAKVIRGEVDKLKREIRASIINQQINPKSRCATAQIRAGNFNISMLAMKCQSLESEANRILSNSNLSRTRENRPLLQSTPVK